MKYGTGYFPINDNVSNGGIINSTGLVELAYIIYLEVKEICYWGQSIQRIAWVVWNIKGHYDKNRTFPIKAILKHKQVDCMRRKMPCIIFNYIITKSIHAL